MCPIPEDSRRRLTIGAHGVELDLRNPHERAYADQLEKSVDFAVAAKLIREGSVVLDLGANVGVTALCYVRFGAREVHAFEPVEELAARIEGIGCSNIKVYRQAVSDTEGCGSLLLSDAHNQGHSLNSDWPKLFPGVFTARVERSVPLTRLDSLFPAQSFDFIKIDVEGEEENVLLGGDHFFARHRGAIVQIEIYDDYFDRTSARLLRDFSNCARLAVGGDGRLLIVAPEDVAPLRQVSSDVVWGPPNYLFWNGGLERLEKVSAYG